MFEIGRYRYDRLRNMNPNLPILSNTSRPKYHRIAAEQKELIRLFMLSQPTEPGYPCQHRSIPIYMEDPNVTFASLYLDYKVECEGRHMKELSKSSFVSIVKFLIPTLHLGRTKTDVCKWKVKGLTPQKLKGCLVRRKRGCLVMIQTMTVSRFSMKVLRVRMEGGIVAVFLVDVTPTTTVIE